MGKLGLMMDPVGRFATLVWPPTGLALAALFLVGTRAWPGVALGAFVTNLWLGAPALVASGIAVGNTLEAVVGVSMLHRIPRFNAGLDRPSDVLRFAFFVAMLSTLISATLGVGSLTLGGILSPSQFGPTWKAW